MSLYALRQEVDSRLEEMVRKDGIQGGSALERRLQALLGFDCKLKPDEVIEAICGLFLREENDMAESLGVRPKDFEKAVQGLRELLNMGRSKRYKTLKIHDEDDRPRRKRGH